MGHYASEMCCSKCGSIHCVCPRPKDESREMWLVDSDLTVMKVKDFDEKYLMVKVMGIKMPIGSPFARRMDKPLFKTEEEAMEHRFVVLDDQIERATREVTSAELKLKLLQATKAALK